MEGSYRFMISGGVGPCSRLSGFTALRFEK